MAPIQTNYAIRVLIADDHEIYRDGLRMMLNKQASIEWLGEANNGREISELAQQLQPDVILMDIVMPVKDGIEATKFIRAHCPGVNVIALSMSNEDNLIIDMLEAGAMGFLLKNTNKKEIVAAIESVYKNIPYYCPSTSSILAKLIARSQFNPFTKNDKLNFSEREIAIMKLVCQEFTNNQIGEQLFISGRTVEGHRLKVQEKINAKSTTGIVIYAIKHGIFKL